MMLEIKKLTRPFERFSHDLIASRIKLLERGIDHPFVVLNDRTRFWITIISEKLPWVLKTERALRSFKEETDKIKEAKRIFYKIRKARNRSPSGYITDILVLIPESNRKIEYQIYDAFGELLRKSRPLLFDLHLIKLKGRKLEEVTPKGFWRYE